MKLFEKQNNGLRIARYSLYQLSTVAACGSAALLIALALYGYDARDASWFFVRTKMNVPHNMLGSFGAHLAGLLMYLFGSASYAIPLTLTYFAYFFAVGITWRKEIDRCVACVALLLVLAALLHTYAIDPLYSAAPGGVIGNLTYRFILVFADPTIVFLSLHVLLFVSLVLLSRLAWVGPMRRVGHGIETALHSALARKMVAAAVSMVSSISNGIARFFGWVWRLLSGKLIDERRDIVPLEFGEIVEQVVHDTTDARFWKNAYGQSSNELPETYAPAEMQQPQSQKTTFEAPPGFFKKMMSMQEERKEKESASAALHQYQLPNPAQFTMQHVEKQSADDQKLHDTRARMLELKLARFGITGKVVAIKPGPVITLFEYEPDIDSKVSKIIALEDDLALALEAVSIRIIAPIPGRSVVGFEVANKDRATVHLSSIIQSKAYAQCTAHLPLVLGHDIVGNPSIVDLADMPHLLVAGSTGSGKSVALNTMLVSLLYRCTPEQLRLILIDPKRLEFASYSDIGHLIFPIVTDPKTAGPVLQWVVRTMEDRYEIMATVGVRNHQAYQRLCATQKDLELMPYLVVMIDELSDLMMTAGKEVEALIARIAQMARAAGIHMIVATQRPSVDVITGLIKVNFPSRISFRVTSKVDSRTILDCVGAEKLLGKGDMLFLSASSALMRVHGAYVGHKEVSSLVEYIRTQQPPQYLDIQEELPLKKGSLLDADDALYQEVLAFVYSTDQISISLLQRRFRIGYNRSARIMETLESEGLIMPSDGSKMRKVIK